MYDVYHKSGTTYESYKYNDSTNSVTYWSHPEVYNTSFTVSLIYPTQQIELNVKKLLKRMADSLCREGWMQHIPYYLEPKTVPIGLRSVRLEGRGWGNR